MSSSRSSNTSGSQPTSRRRRKAETPTAATTAALARSMDEALDTAVEQVAPHQTGAPDPDHAPAAAQEIAQETASADPVTEPVTEPVTLSAPAAAGDPSERVTNEGIARLDGDITHMEAQLAALQSQRDTIEAEHAAHAASSQLALRLELVGCDRTTEIFPDGPHASLIPQYVWHSPCHLEKPKQQPDQDCRECAHVIVTPLGRRKSNQQDPTGQEDRPWQRRYPKYGAVIPLSLREVDALDHYLMALGRPALRRVDAEIWAVSNALDNARAARAAEVRREIERQQGGR